MKLFALLADKALVSPDGFLGILGGGVSILSRSEFPAPVSADLVLFLDPEQAAPGDLTLDFSIVKVEADGSEIELHSMSSPGAAADDEMGDDGRYWDASQSVVIDISDFLLPEPGRYKAIFDITSPVEALRGSAELRFRAVLASV